MHIVRSGTDKGLLHLRGTSRQRQSTRMTQIKMTTARTKRTTLIMRTDKMDHDAAAGGVGAAVTLNPTSSAISMTNTEYSQRCQPQKPSYRGIS